MERLVAGHWTKLLDLRRARSVFPIINTRLRLMLPQQRLSKVQGPVTATPAIVNKGHAGLSIIVGLIVSHIP